MSFSRWFLIGMLFGQGVIQALPGENKKEIKTHLFAVEAAYNSGEEKANIRHVLAEVDGRVYDFNGGDIALLKSLELAARDRWLVKLEFASNSEIVSSVELLERTEVRKDADSENWAPQYQASAFSSMSDAQAIYDSLWDYTNTSLEDNCYQRAQIWTRLLQMRHGYKTMKTFLLFTQLYRRKFNYKWWYHVAPFVYVQNGNSHREVVIDPSFIKGPLDIGPWVYRFAKHTKHCINGQSLEHFNSVNNSQYCLAIRRSMYHFTPFDLSSNVSLNGWRCSDLRKTMTTMPAPSKSGRWREFPQYLPNGCY